LDRAVWGEIPSAETADFDTGVATGELPALHYELDSQNVVAGEGSLRVIVAASTDCFPELTLPAALDRLTDLEYTSVEMAVHEGGKQITPSQIAAEFDRVLLLCRQTRLTTVAYSLDIKAEGETYYDHFQACCKLAKATKVVALCIPSAELGTPFNAEIERLRRMVAIATKEGVLVGVKTQIGCLTENPDTTVVLCDNVKGLGVTLDPSHYIFGPHRGKYSHLIKHVIHVQLRDTTKDRFQVRVGQGEIEYGRLVTQLAKVNYRRALSVNIAPMEDVDHAAEMRKMRLLLESLL
jgi:sugar phosphate isomerase/epimerase